MVTRTSPPRKRRAPSTGVSSLSVAGYKSLFEPASIRIAPLTILAGANSSGKSSIMQPLLLLKQTLEASYDPGALMLRGPNVQLTSTDQLFSNCGKGRRAHQFSVEIGTSNGEVLRTVLTHRRSGGLDVLETERKWQNEHLLLTATMEHETLLSSIPISTKKFGDRLFNDPSLEARWEVRRRRCFLDLAIAFTAKSDSGQLGFSGSGFYGTAEGLISRILHLPGLRGNPVRTYPITAVESNFPGPFPSYTASIVAQWQDDEEAELISELNSQMASLNLANRVHAERVNDTEVELRVSRVIGRSGRITNDLVSIADVGLGVSQTLPVVISLLIAHPGQLVYIEQPEIHLHPRAQFNMADVLISAAKRGVHVVVETHSSVTLLGIQAAVAEGRIGGHDVALHWFSRDHFGQTRVQSVELGDSGEFGEWPEDFSDVYLQAQGRYLDAVEKRQLAD